MGHDQPYKSEPDEPGRSRDGHDFAVEIEMDEPSELKYNATPWPFRKLAERQMKNQDIAPVPDYDVVITGPDAAHIVHDQLAEIEVGVLVDKHDRRIERGAVTPGDFVMDHDRNAFTVRNPVDLKPLVTGGGRHGEPWPDHYSVGIRLIDRNGDYIMPDRANA